MQCQLRHVASGCGRAPHTSQPVYVPSIHCSSSGSSRIAPPLAAAKVMFGKSSPVENWQEERVMTTSIIAHATNQSVAQLHRASSTNVRKKAAYQGVPGAYSEVATRKACPAYDPMPCEQFEVAFQALSQWLADRAVLPVENSLGGSIHAVYDLLLRYPLHIVSETSVKVNHCLVALPGTKKSELTKVMSHPQALSQCDGYLRQLGVIKEAVDDTAGAAQMVSQGHMQNVGALCSRRAAELYNLEILDEGVQDVKENITRFIVLSRDPLVVTTHSPLPYKTSVVFSLKEGSGQLFKALSCFALRDIDLTKIESRPMRSSPMINTATRDGALSSQDDTVEGRPSTPAAAGSSRFNYLFYVDFLGSLAEERCQNALRHLQEFATMMRVLGSYPMDTELGFTTSDDPLATQVAL